MSGRAYWAGGGVPDPRPWIHAATVSICCFVRTSPKGGMPPPPFVICAVIAEMSLFGAPLDRSGPGPLAPTWPKKWQLVQPPLAMISVAGRLSNFGLPVRAVPVGAPGATEPASVSEISTVGTVGPTTEP